MATTYLRRKPRMTRKRLSAADLVGLPGSAFQRNLPPDPRIGAEDPPGLDPAFSLNPNTLPRPGRTMFLPDGPDLPPPDTAAGITTTPVYPPQFQPSQVIEETALAPEQNTGFGPMDVESPEVGFSAPATSQERSTYVKPDEGFGSPTALALLSAGLGILANNTGHYGQAGPAIGKGGLIGLNTFMQLKQQQADQRRQEAQMSMQRDQHRAYQRQVAAQELRAQREEAKDNRIQAAMRTLTEMPENDPNRERVRERLAWETGQGAAYMRVQKTAASRQGGTEAERSFAIVSDYVAKLQAGEMPTDEETRAFANATKLLQKPKTIFDPTTGNLYQYPTYDMPSYVPGVGQQGLRAVDIPNRTGRKPLEQKDQEALEASGKRMSELDGLLQNFKPNYGNWKLDTVAELALKAGRALPESVVGPERKDEALWWMRYYESASVERLAQTGLTLTKAEQDAYEAYTPKPSDSADVIKANLERRRQIVLGAMVKKMNGLVAEGKNPAAIEGYLGLTPDDGSSPAAPVRAPVDDKERERQKQKYLRSGGGASGRF